MSPVPLEPQASQAPLEPQASQAPPSLATSTTPDAEPTSTKKSTFPEPKLRLELRDVCHKSTDLFLKNFNSAKDFACLVETVLNRLYTVQDSDDHVSATRPTPSYTKIPGTRSVTLILRDMDGVAYTTGTDLDNDHKEIHLSLSYLKHVASQQPTYPARTELLGVVCHELVHCFQWNGKDTCNGGLIEGIADWVRLNAGYIPPHWKRVAGKSWDSGYQNTAYFLDWIEKTRGKGSVFKINQQLAHKEYKEDAFWKDLFGHHVDSLWKDYAESLEKDKDESLKKDNAESLNKDKDDPESYGDPNLKMQIRIKKDVEGA